MKRHVNLNLSKGDQRVFQQSGQSLTPCFLLNYVEPANLFFAADSGLMTFSRELARAKVAALLRSRRS